MLKLKKIAITGGIASGKSTVCQFLKELGAYVVHTDDIVHELLENDTDLGKQTIKLLGSEILENGKISRRLIAEKVFRSGGLLEEFEKLIHPSVLKSIEELYSKACKANKYTSFIVEFPLLFEIKAESFYDIVVAVVADEKIARHRFETAGFEQTEYDRRMKRQLSPSQKAAQAHFTIINDGSFEDLRKQVIAFYQTL